MASVDSLAILICAAINAFPPLAAELTQLAPPTSPVTEVFSAHGGDKFGEKDNTQDLAAIRQWLSKLALDDARILGQLSIHGLLKTLLPGTPDTRLAIGVYGLRRFTAEELCQVLEQHEMSVSVPSLLFVHGSMPVSVFDGATTVDLDRGTPVDSQRVKALEAARIKHAGAMALCSTVGIPDRAASGQALMLAMQALMSWLSSSEQKAPNGTLDCMRTLGPLLSGSVGCWEQVAARLDETTRESKQALRNLERTRKYVLRAFVVEGPPGIHSVVRRFGKAQEASHYSVLGGDGVCWPTRLRDIVGTVVESMWVCCSDEECDDVGESGLNTVVADPDDEIFCDVCQDFESWSYNQIIICDGCERGVHQICHMPVVTEGELTQDQWFCESCKPVNQAKKRVRSK
ncbi:mitochondrial transcription factor 2 [Coemansia sp. 'formosensis']|nr:mitochondrial transcription factor 2 [Coemansia sp. 'formosensis']